MMMRLNPILLLSVAVAGHVAASPISLQKRAEVLFGYRRVAPAEAEKINEAGTLIYDPIFMDAPDAIHQTGKGVYTSASREGWEGAPGDWTCAVWVDSDALNSIGKAWIPLYDASEDDDDDDDDEEEDSSNELWWNDEKQVTYIESLELSPAATLRLSIIEYNEPNVQCLVLPELLGQDGTLKLRAECYENVEDAPGDVIDYDSWQNVLGSKEPEEEEEEDD